MRISDWGSDDCSSDLGARGDIGGRTTVFDTDVLPAKENGNGKRRCRDSKRNCDDGRRQEELQRVMCHLVSLLVRSEIDTGGKGADDAVIGIERNIDVGLSVGDLRTTRDVMSEPIAE